VHWTYVRTYVRLPPAIRISTSLIGQGPRPDRNAGQYKSTKQVAGLQLTLNSGFQQMLPFGSAASNFLAWLGFSHVV